jgi:methyltransferase (TIGR00027 family)
MMIENISDTARWVAVYRAMETERPDALFRDHFARKLAGRRGEDIVKSMPRGRASAWAMIVRTAVMDEMIMDIVRSGEVDLILNLAAGLDARPWRLDLPTSLRWVDVDLPHILQYKTETIGNNPAKCRYECIPADLTDGSARRDLFKRLASECGRAMIVTEGLLIYLSAEQVAALTADLHSAGAFHHWLIDLANPTLLALMRRTWGKSLTAAGSPFQFAPPEGTEFFEQRGWKPKAVRATLAEARRLKREMPMAGFWRLVSHFFPRQKRKQIERMAAVVLLEREATL